MRLVLKCELLLVKYNTCMYIWHNICAGKIKNRLQQSIFFSHPIIVSSASKLNTIRKYLSKYNRKYLSEYNRKTHLST